MTRRITRRRLLKSLTATPFACWLLPEGLADAMMAFSGGQGDEESCRGLCRRFAGHERGRGGICTGEICAKPGEKLRFRGYFKAIGAHGPCFVNFEGDPGDGWERIDLPGKADYDWTEVSGAVTVKPPRRGQELDPDGNVRIFVFIYTKAFGELWIDDVTLTPVE